MYNFQMELKDDERILYLGKPEAGKGKRSIKTDIQVLFVCLIFIGVGTALLLFGRDGSTMSIVLPIILLVVGALFLLVTISSIYNKKKGIDEMLAKTSYCITNQRVLRMDEEVDVLMEGKLKDYQQMEIEDEKDGYGTLLFINEKAIGDEPLVIPFEYIRNPLSVKEIAEQAGEEA